MKQLEKAFKERLGIDNFDLELVLTFILKGGYYKDIDDNIQKANFITFDFQGGTFGCHRANGMTFIKYEDIGKEIAQTKRELKNGK